VAILSTLLKQLIGHGGYRQTPQTTIKRPCRLVGANRRHLWHHRTL